MFDNITEKIKEANYNLVRLHSILMDDTTLEAIKKEEANLDDWLHKNEILWAQKSRVNWLKWGDRNSKFSHLTTMIRRAKNKILTIKKPNGDWVKGQGNIQYIAKDFFSSLFETKGPSKDKILEITEKSYLFLSEESKDMLEREFSNDEITKTVFQMGKLKASDPDGFQAGFFFQEY